MLRFAPSPTGDMHIGNLRVALINYVIAKQQQKPFLVRIEDTDRDRNIIGKDTEIVLILEKFGIIYDELYHQSEHARIHRDLAYRLLQEEKAFACTCSPEEIERERTKAKESHKPYRYSGKCRHRSFKDAQELLSHSTPFSIRIKKPQEPITFHDTIKGERSTQGYDIDDFIILRADQSPTYNFACACDDMLSAVTMVIRGEDHLSNTPKQIHIHRSLGYQKSPHYAHLPIILNDEGKKMSKRDNASSLKWLFEQGFVPDAIANYLLLIGNAKVPNEFFTLQDAIAWFKLENLSKSPARFDLDKLRQLNRLHIQTIDDKELSRYFGFADAAIGRLAKLYLEEASTLGEIKSKIELIFKPKPTQHEFAPQMEQIRSILKEAPPFDDFDELKAYIVHQTGLKGKNLFKPLRILLTGQMQGPELSEVYPHIKSYLLEVIA